MGYSYLPSERELRNLYGPRTAEWGRMRALLLFNLLLVAGVPLVVGSPLLSTSMLRSVLQTLEERDEPQPSDALVVLGSGIDCETGGLDRESSARAAHAAKLVGEGWATQVVVTDSPPETCEGLAARQQEVIQAAVPGRLLSFFVVGNCLNTHDEAVAAAALARQQGWKSILLVTSPTHSRRAAALYRAQGLEVRVSPSAPGTYNAALLTEADRRAAMNSVRHELLGWGQAIKEGWLKSW